MNSNLQTKFLFSKLVEIVHFIITSLLKNVETHHSLIKINTRFMRMMMGVYKCLTRTVVSVAEINSFKGPQGGINTSDQQ